MLKTSSIKSMAQTLRDMKYSPIKEDTDKSEPGTQGDKEAYQKKPWRLLELMVQVNLGFFGL